ncbi:CapA family protein [Bernardetia sp. OM2101]|uniref:CapA family protein n=1 Tax=Bernardetia sp. OM2101 TaxID=3344876 RepID=UPI0035D07EF9
MYHLLLVGVAVLKHQQGQKIFKTQSSQRNEVFFFKYILQKYFVILFLGLFLCFSCQNSNTENPHSDKKEINSKPIKLLFGGDILLDRGVRVEIEKKGVVALFDNLKPIFDEYQSNNDSENNFILANLECPLTNESSPIPKRFSFRAPSSYADSLKKVGFTHLFLANNHTNDHHRKGLSNTFNALKKAGIIGIGYGETHSESCEPIFIEKGSNKEKTKIAIFSVVRVPLENWYRMEEKPSICQLGTQELVEKVKQLKQKEPQTIIIISLHWGTEYKFSPRAEQRKEAHLLTLAGADAIIGHHPHVTQSIEFVNEKPVFYSLGNFVFDQEGEFRDRCILLEFEIQSKKINRILVYPLEIKNCVPQFFSDSEKDSVEKAIFENQLQNLSKSVRFEYIKKDSSHLSSLLIQKK